MRKLAPVLALAVLWGCSANPDKLVPREAANAMSGSPATLTAVSTMTIEGSGINFDWASGGDPATALHKFNVTSYKRTMAFGRGRWRQVQVRIPDAAASGATLEKEISGLDGTIAFDLAADGTPSRLPDEVAKIRRAELLHYPIGYLEAVFSDAGQVSNTRTEGGMEAVDMTIDGETYSLFIDGKTKLPAKIISKIHTSSRGDMVMETSFGNYVPAYGYKMPGKITTKLDNNLVADLTIEQQFFGGATGDLTAPKQLKPAGGRGASAAGKQPVDRPPDQTN